jgi:hypothetical protein
MPQTRTIRPPAVPDEVPFYARALLKAFQSYIISKAHRQVRKQHAENLVQLENTLKIISETREKMEPYLPKGAAVYNVAQFAFVIQYDISILAHDVLLSPDGWKRKLYSRLLALTLIESVEDVSQMLGWKFRQTVKAIYNDAALDTRIMELTRAMGHFESKHGKALREIRHTVSAHRDHDAKTQLRVIGGLDCQRLLALTADFVAQNRQVLDLLYDLITAAEKRFLYLKML